MDTQFISNVFLPGISLLLTAISLGVVVITLRQNSKMLEASSRPVISIYAQSIELDTSSLYLVVKNFGNSTAYLTKFVSDFDFSGCYFDLPGDYLEQLSSCTIAPGQSRVCLLDSNKVKDKVHFSIE